MIDLSKARNALEKMSSSSKKLFKIGITTRDFSNFASYKKMEVVLFRNDGDGTLTVETPYSPEMIRKNRANGSLIVSAGCMINVPSSYVEEVII